MATKPVIRMSWVLDTAFSIHTSTTALFRDKYLYVGNDDYNIRVWNVMTGQLYRKLQGHSGIITGFAFAPKYDLLFSCSIDGSIITWHGTTLVYKYVHYQPPENRFPSPVYSIYFDSDSEVLVAGMDGYVATFELSPTVLAQLVAHANTCPFTLRQCVKLHRDRVTKIIGNRRRIFTASFDRTIASSQLMDISISKVISRHQTSVSSIIFDEFTQNLLIGDHSGIIKVFSADGLALGTLTDGAVENSIASMFYDNNLKLLWYVMSDGSVNLMDVMHPTQNITGNFDFFKNLPVAGADKPKFEIIVGNGLGSRVIALVNHKYIYTWKWSKTACCSKFQLTNKPVNCVFLYNYKEDDPSFTRQRKARVKTDKSCTEPLPRRVNSSLVAHGVNMFAGGATTVAVRPLSEYVHKSDELMQEANCSAMDFCYPEAALFCGFKSGKVRMLSLSSPKSFTEVHCDGFPIIKVFVFDRQAISICGDWSICMWKLSHESLELLHRRERAHDCEITSAAFSANRKQFMTCDTKGFCRIWEIGEEDFKEKLLVDHSSYGGIIAATYAPSADMWLCASVDHFVRGWLASAPLSPSIMEYCVSPCNVTALAAGLTNDVYIATDDKTIRLICCRRSEEKAVYLGHTQLITDIYIPPEGKKWVSLQWDGQVYFWLLPDSSMRFSSHGATENTTATTTARLPKLMHRSDHSRQTTNVPEEPMISLYEKSRKTLLLQRREGEKQLRMKKKSQEWKRISQIHQIVLTAMNTADEKKRASSQLV